MNYQEILDDPIIIGEYAKVDAVNREIFNHGVKHIKGVVCAMDKLTRVFGITGEEKNDLMVSAVLHDIGQTELRHNHELKGKIFAEKYLTDKLPVERMERILVAIENHRGDRDTLETTPLFANLLALADKLDFTQQRLDDNWAIYVDPGYKNIYKDIIGVDISKTDRDLIVAITSNGNITAEDVQDDPVFFQNHKVKNVVDAVSRKLGLKPKMQLDGEVLYG